MKWSGLFALGLLSACSPSTAGDPSFRLAGEEAQLREGGLFRPVFHRSRAPRFLIRGANCESWRIELSDARGRHDASVVEGARAGAIVLQSRTSTAPVAGPGRARLFCDDEMMAEVALEWREAPEDIGARGSREVSDIWTRVYLENSRAKKYLASGRPLEAEQAWLSAQQIAGAADEPRLAERIAYTRVFAKYMSGDLEGARGLLESLPNPPSLDRARAWRAHFHGQISSAFGDLREAEDALRAATRLTAEQGELGDFELSQVELAEVLARQGRWNEALVALGELEKEPAAFPRSELTRATIHNLVGWVMLGATQSGALNVDLSRAENNLRLAQNFASQSGSVEARAYTSVCLAIFYLAVADVESAKRELGLFESEGVLQDSTVRPFAELARIEVVLLEGRAREAIEQLERFLGGLADTSMFQSELRWRAEHLRGRALAAAGDLSLAEAAFRRALALLAREGEKLPADAGGIPALWRRREPSLDLIELLRLSGRELEAFWIADALHAAKLDELSAQASGARRERAVEYPSLSLPANIGVLSLLSGPRNIWTAFFVVGGRAQVVRGAEPIAALLPAFEALERLYVIPGGNSLAFDLASMNSSSGAPLGAKVEISLIPHARVLLEKSVSNGPALVVADPTRDLPDAAEEGELVARGIRGATLLSGVAGTRDSVRERWANAGVFHFAGHGALGARRAWDAHLLLHDSAITLRDILIDRPAPRLVVLAACETGARLEPTRINLSEAFLHGGSGAVLATVREVGDEKARRFVDIFYQQNAMDHPNRAFRLSIAESVARGDDSWKAFRLWGGRLELEGDSL